jgi:hypothetical protein
MSSKSAFPIDSVRIRAAKSFFKGVKVQATDFLTRAKPANMMATGAHSQNIGLSTSHKIKFYIQPNGVLQKSSPLIEELP